MSSPSVPLDIYVMRGSAPCRAVLLACRLLGVEHNVHEVDLMNGEQNTPEFLAMNPQHCVPTIRHGERTLWESRAILQYVLSLSSDYSRLYAGTDAFERSHIARLCCFDLGTLYSRIARYVYPQLFRGVDGSTLSEQLTELEGALDTLSGFIGESESVSLSGRDLPDISDISIACSLTMLEFYPDILAQERFSRVRAWQSRVTGAMQPDWDEVTAPFNAWRDSKLNASA